MTTQDGNTALEVLHDAGAAGENEALKRRIAELEGLLAEGADDNVSRPEAFQEEIPKYYLNGSTYLEDDTLHVEGEEIDYTGPVNDTMVPINDAAHAKVRAWIDARIEVAREEAERRGVPFHGLITDKGVMIAQARQDAVRSQSNVKVISMPERGGDVPQMPQHEEAKSLARRRGRPPKSAAVVSSKAPEKQTRHGTMPAPIIGTTRNAV